MAHPRKLARQAIVALLIAANTAAADRVSVSRVDPHKRSQLPAITVYSHREQSERSGEAPRELERVADIEVALWIGGRDEDEIIDALDDLCEQVEAAIDTSIDGDCFGGTASDAELVGTEIELRAEDGRSDPLVGIAVLTYEVTYYSSPALVDTLDDLVRVNAKIAREVDGVVVPVGDVPDTSIPEDTFNVQET